MIKEIKIIILTDKIELSFAKVQSFSRCVKCGPAPIKVCGELEIISIRKM